MEHTIHPTRWSGQTSDEFGPSLELHFGDFHQIVIDNDGVEFVVFSRNGFVVREKKLSWEELFALVLATGIQTGEGLNSEAKS